MTALAIKATRRGWFAWQLGALCAMPTVLSPAAPPVMQDAATHEQLAQQWRKAQPDDPMKALPAATGAVPAGQPGKDLLSQSDILCFGGMATLVPKRAILQLPKAMTGRTQFAAGSTLLGWAEFYARNRGWITTVEVSQLQAEGSVPLPEELTKRLLDQPNLVVATYLGGPISVLPIKRPSAAPTSQSESIKP